MVLFMMKENVSHHCLVRGLSYLPMLMPILLEEFKRSKSTTGYLIRINNSPDAPFKRDQPFTQPKPRVTVLNTLFEMVSPVVYQDNQSRIRMSTDSVMNARTKYYRVSQHYLRYCFDTGIVCFEYLSSEDMPCDMLNKFMSYVPFSRHLPLINWLILYITKIRINQASSKYITCAGALDLSRSKFLDKCSTWSFKNVCLARGVVLKF